jgi:hypothetical protein
MKKKKHNHIIGILYFFIFAFFLGFFYTLLVYQGIWSKITQGLGLIPLWAYPLWLLFSFYLTLSLHELGHFFAFLFQHIKIRALYITMFIFYRDQKGWKFSINPKLWALAGGLVVPDLGEMNDEETYQKTVKSFAISLWVAPIVTIVFLIISIISTLLITIFSSNITLIGIFIINTIFISLLSTLYIYSFKLSNPMFYGDLVAYKKMKDDPVFQLIQVSQYTLFSLYESKSTNDFLFKKIEETIKQTVLNHTLFHTLLLTQYIEDILVNKYPIDPQIDHKLRHLNIQPYLRNEQGFMLVNDLIYFHYVNKDVALAYHLLNQTYSQTYPKLNEKLFNYMRKKTYHLVHLEDNQAFLDNKDNLYLGIIWIFDRLIDPYAYLSESHEPLPYTPYVCEINLEAQEENKKSDEIA